MRRSIGKATLAKLALAVTLLCTHASGAEEQPSPFSGAPEHLSLQFVRHPDGTSGSLPLSQVKRIEGAAPPFEVATANEVFHVSWAQIDNFQLNLHMPIGRPPGVIDASQIIPGLTNLGWHVPPAGSPPPKTSDAKQRGWRVEDTLRELTDPKAKRDPVIGRDKWMERVEVVLGRRRKRNPLLVGEPGVGKTALVEGLAERWIAEERGPLFALDLVALTAGTNMRGDFEKRFKEVLTEVKRREGTLFIDELHMTIGAGRADGNSMDLANMLKPELARGELRVIGATTYAEYLRHFRNDGALRRRFQPILVDEPSLKKTRSILSGAPRAALEAHHGIEITRGAVKAAVELSEMLDRHDWGARPDSVLTLLDTASSETARRGRTRLTAKILRKSAARVTRRALGTSGRKAAQRALDFERVAGEHVIGQPDAIARLARAARRIASGVQDTRRPPSFLFRGPTGVGKTELTMVLAKLLPRAESEPVRLDMSEFMERHSVARLIGAPPGYVGFEQPGLLTDAVTKHPHSVLLLDEVEKAHPDVFNLLLQVLDEGRLTDGHGRTVDFRNTVVVMTSNLGSTAKRSIGFATRDDADAAVEATAASFRPELRNRIDYEVDFVALRPKHLTTIARKLIAEGPRRRLKRKGVRLHVTRRAIEQLATNDGFDPALGARPMRRAIERLISDPAADALLLGRAKKAGGVGKGGAIVIDYAEGRYATHIRPARGVRASGRHR